MRPDPKRAFGDDLAGVALLPVLFGRSGFEYERANGKNHGVMRGAVPPAQLLRPTVPDPGQTSLVRTAAAEYLEVWPVEHSDRVPVRGIWMITDRSERAFDQRPEGWDSGAAGYDSWFAPLTRLYAIDACQLLSVRAGQSLLDVAAGTGALTLVAAEGGVDVTAVDFAPGMVEFLRRRLEDASLGGRVLQMDAQDLVFPDGSFDAGCSMFGLIFLPDVNRGFRELARVVKPGGRILVAAWARDRFPLPGAVQTALSRTVPGYVPPDAPPPSMRLGSTDDLIGEFGRAGLGDVTVTEVSKLWKIGDPERLFIEGPSWAPPLRHAFQAVPADLLPRAAAAFARVVAEMGGESGLEMTALLACATR